MKNRRTKRGFRVFAEGIPCLFGGSVRLEESSVALEGAHVWIFHDDAQAEDVPRVDVRSARKIVRALERFIKEAEAGKLTEPARWTERMRKKHLQISKSEIKKATSAKRKTKR